MSAGDHEGKRWQAPRITAWFAILGAAVAFRAGAGALFLRWFR